LSQKYTKARNFDALNTHHAPPHRLPAGRQVHGFTISLGGYGAGVTFGPIL
jgi:hypothetical protein